VDQRQDMVRRGGEPQAGDGWRPSERSHAEEAIWKEEGASSFSYRVGGIIGVHANKLDHLNQFKCAVNHCHGLRY
jgi:uncharacterized protein with beta-barrel porin domain